MVLFLTFIEKTIMDISNNLRETIVRHISEWDDEFIEKLANHDFETFLNTLGINSHEYTHPFPDIFLKTVIYGAKKIVENGYWEVIHK
jgi:hypothetical protein